MSFALFQIGPMKVQGLMASLYVFIFSGVGALLKRSFWASEFFCVMPDRNNNTATVLILSKKKSLSERYQAYKPLRRHLQGGREMSY
jgi:hypothetical protein